MRNQKPEDETLSAEDTPGMKCEKCKAQKVEIEYCIVCRKDPDRCQCIPQETESKFICPNCGG